MEAELSAWGPAAALQAERMGAHFMSQQPIVSTVTCVIGVIEY